MYTTNEELIWRNIFSVRLETIMEEKEFTQSRLAKETGLSISAIHKYLNGCSSPSAYNIYLIANALDCTVGDLAYF